MEPESNLKQESVKTKFAFRGVVRVAGAMLTLAACLIATQDAEAHLTYSGRDLGSYSGLTNATATLTNQTVTGNYGWADAADGILGDSHRGRVFRFRLTNFALVSVTVVARPTTNLLVITPAFSVYSGLGAIAPFSGTQTDSDHDGSLASLAWRTYWVQQNLNPAATDPGPTDGVWNSVADWKIGGDGDLTNDFSQLSSLIYKGSAAATGAATNISGSFALAPGDYSIMVGGNDITDKIADTALLGRGITITLSVAPLTISITPKVFVAWPVATSTTNWVLQSASSINTTNWTTVTNAPVTVDGQPGVVLNSSAAQQFFRLNYVP